MKIIADLHLHSKYSRAVSPEMVLPTMALWAEKKGLDLLATGDWTHPLWLKEIETQLQEDSEGIFKIKGSRNKIRFLLSTEISNIYSQNGKGHRVHTLFFAPNFQTVHKINEAIARRGGNLMSDGRPIIGLTLQETCELVWDIDERVLVVPAHCLPAEEKIVTDKGLIKINEIKKNNLVLTHNGRYQKVCGLFKRKYSGKLYKIIPWNFSQGLSTTPEHPYLTIKTVKKCRSTGDICRPFGKHVLLCRAKHYLKYKPEWVAADKLEIGDLLLYPIFLVTTDIKIVKISDIIEGLEKNKNQVRIKSGRSFWINNQIKLNGDFGRLIGYYLAEGYIYGTNGIGFCFSNLEKELVEDVKKIVNKIFGIDKFREYQRGGSNGLELSFSSTIVTEWFKKWFYQEKTGFRANNKQLPNWMLGLDRKFQEEMLIGWWLGDKGYTVSQELANQMKIICLRLGIIPSIRIDKIDSYDKRGKHILKERIIQANHDLYCFNGLSFISVESKKIISRMKDRRLLRKLNRNHGWIKDKYVYLPIRKIEKRRFSGSVYNLEVEKDNSYTAEFGLVHNCWTPWFSVFGSKSGFDSLEEAFGQYASKIYAVETGLSSDPLMNWKIKDLQTRSILSNSDSHSPRKMGREATVLDLEKDNYTFTDISEALKVNSKTKNKIAYTIEFHPEEGKYHYTGHRSCSVVQSPAESREKGTVCHVCGRPLTVGVEHRVEQLSSDHGLKPIEKTNKYGVKGYFHPTNKNRPPYVMLVPLSEIISEALGVGPASKKVNALYEKMISILGNELQILLKIDLKKIELTAGEKIAEGIKWVRSGNMIVEPGYDGVFGVVKIWPSPKEKNDAKLIADQKSLF